jgi:glycosyltransferase 2 family protein
MNESSGRPASRFRRFATWRLVRVASGILGLSFLLVALVRTWNRSSHATFLLPAWRPVTAIALLTGAVRLTAVGWATLLEGKAPKDALLKSFIYSQPGKYIPGAVWQAMGQIGLAAEAGIPLKLASAAFPVHVVTILAAAGAVGTLLAATGSHLSIPARLIGLVGLIPVLLLKRQWMARVASFVQRPSRSTTASEVIPLQDAILRSFGWTVAAFSLSCAAYSVLFPRLQGLQFVAVGAGFALAWICGYVALPFPAGLGVREAALVAILGPFGTANVIAASVWHRLAAILSELLSIGIARVRFRRSNRATNQSHQ